MAAGPSGGSPMRLWSTLLVMIVCPALIFAAPALKPSEQRVLYVSGDEGDRQIYMVKLDGTGSEKITSGEGDHMFPAWSPDGKKIAFSLVKDGQQHIHVM